MKTRLLFIFLLAGLFVGAQETPVKAISCDAYFKYEINTKVMSFVPATAYNFYGYAKATEGVKISYFWDFGDGTQSQEQNPMHVYIHPTPGPLVKISPYRTVSLTILTEDSCKSMYSETINIMDGETYTEPALACVAGFKYSETVYDSINGTVTFQTTNRSEGDSLSYFWKFDNGITSTEKEPSITFDIKPEKHLACLTVTSANGCSDEFCDMMYFYNPDKPEIDSTQCKAKFNYRINYDIKTFAAALTLDFSSYASPEAVEWHWDFGDGTTSDEANPTHGYNFPIITDSIHTDPNPFREVCLTVKTASGCEAKYCQTINIYKETFQPEEPVENQCLARFKYNKPTDIMTIPELVPFQFNDASEGEITSRIWKFEDGTIRTDADPQVNFSVFKATQKVCLTIFTDSCSDTYCETVYVSGVKPDTIYTGKPVSNYSMHYISSFPEQMSSCAGYVKAEVYLNDSVIDAEDFAWSHGAIGQEAKGFCPTQIYTVKAVTSDGTIVSGTFIFNSDGTVTEIPMNWWVTNVQDNPQIRYTIYNQDYTIEWKLCDGTIVKNDSLLINSKFCANEDATLLLKDASGNVLYTENVSMKTLVTGIKPQAKVGSVKLFPNPVNDVLNIRYSGNSIDEMQLEILDITGRSVSKQKIYRVDSGQTISLNVNSLRKGIYVCKMTEGNRLINQQKFSK